MWVYDAETKRMVNREVKYVPGFFKIVDEILVNAADNKVSTFILVLLKTYIHLQLGERPEYGCPQGRY
jgi:DNA topoisomerase II